MMVVWVGCNGDDGETELKIGNLVIQLGGPDSYIAQRASENW